MTPLAAGVTLTEGLRHCPAHPDHRPSLSIRREADRWLVHCFAGCGASEVLDALGLDWQDLFPERLADERLPRVTKPWRSSDVIKAFTHELMVAWVILADVAAGKSISETDRALAGLAGTRIARFMEELDNAG